MKKVLVLNKPIGITSLECLQDFVVKNPEYKDAKLGYAGTLDPMASGVLLILVGEENKKRAKYLELKKTYEFEVLFGVATDTYDVLGLIKEYKIISPSILRGKLDQCLIRLTGKILQDLPPFSSTIIKGHPLFWWARNNKINELNLKPKEREVYGIEVLKVGEKSAKAMQKEIFKNVSLVKAVPPEAGERRRGDFRQEEIKKEWEKFFKKMPPTQKFQIAKIIVQVSKGTYVRQLAVDIGKELGVPALAYSIKRMKIGKNNY